MKSRKTYIHKRTGFTLIEVSLAIAIIMIVGGAGLFVGFDQYRGYSLLAERDNLAAMLQRARNQAMTNINEAPHGLSVQSQNFVVFQGASYAARNTAYDEIFPRYALVSTSGINEVVFRQLRGDVAAGTGDINLTNGLKTLTVSVNGEGRINW